MSRQQSTSEEKARLEVLTNCLLHKVLRAETSDSVSRIARDAARTEDNEQAMFPTRHESKRQQESARTLEVVQRFLNRCRLRMALCQASEMFIKNHASVYAKHLFEESVNAEIIDAYEHETVRGILDELLARTVQENLATPVHEAEAGPSQQLAGSSRSRLENRPNEVARIELEKNFDLRTNVLIHRCWDFVHASYIAKAKLSLAPSEDECAFEFLLRVAIAHYHAHVHSKYGFSLSSLPAIPKFIELCLKDYLLKLNHMGDCNQPAKTVAKNFTKEVVLEEMRKAWKAILGRHPEEHARFEERMAEEKPKATVKVPTDPGAHGIGQRRGMTPSLHATSIHSMLSSVPHQCYNLSKLNDL
uniref:Uncharacterized protein n=1 Tax=Steinernema glaseri TaxID=37863 RepID=A0A1I8AUA9_9BILA